MLDVEYGPPSADEIEARFQCFREKARAFYIELDIPMHAKLEDANEADLREMV